MAIYEIKPMNTPEIAVNNYYPKLTEYGIEKPTNGVTITYHNTSVQKLYKIDTSEWKEYNGEEIILEIGKTIYAKGIDKNGKETINIAEYTSNLVYDELGLEAYDGNEETCVEVLKYETKKMYVDSAVQGNNFYIVFSTYNDAWCYPSITFYSSKGEELGGENYSSKDKYELQLEIPIETDYIEFHSDGASGRSAQMSIYEIRK